MLTTLLGALAEQALNQVLKLSPSLKEQLTSTCHRLLVVHIRDWQQQVGVLFSGTAFHVFMDVEGKGDCWVSADLNTLQSLKDPSKLTLLIRQNQLDLEGDIHLAQTFSRALSNVDIDWPEHISHYLGDAPAQHLCDGLNKTKLKAQTQQKWLAKTWTELCQDELKITIHPIELEQFTEHTRALKQHVDSLEQRINALLSSKE